MIPKYKGSQIYNLLKMFTSKCVVVIDNGIFTDSIFGFKPLYSPTGNKKPLSSYM